MTSRSCCPVTRRWRAAIDGLPGPATVELDPPAGDSNLNLLFARHPPRTVGKDSGKGHLQQF